MELAEASEEQSRLRAEAEALEAALEEAQEAAEEARAKARNAEKNLQAKAAELGQKEEMLGWGPSTPVAVQCRPPFSLLC